MKSITLSAPLDGVLVPIDTVPDPVFAQKMVGEGISIDPLSNELVAPCDAEVAQLQSSLHAITLRHASGLEILIHIGLDTVGLDGEGFTSHVNNGDQVKAGDKLITFDMDLLAHKAKSLLTQVVISNSDVLESFAPESGVVVSGRDRIATCEIGDTASQAVADGASRTGEAVIVLNPTGIHARPAANLVAAAKDFQSTIWLLRGEDHVNAKSIVGIMSLEIVRGEKIQFKASGPDADEAIQRLNQAVQDGLGEEVPDGPIDAVDAADGSSASGAAATDAELLDAPPRSGDPNLLLGVAASPGLGIGEIVRLQRAEITVDKNGEDKHKERRKLNAAIDRAQLELQALQDKMDDDPDHAAIFAAHGQLLDDPDLLDLASGAIDKGRSAAYAWQQAYTSYADRLSQLKNELFAARATDVRDVGMRVLEELTGHKAQGPELPAEAILVAEDLTPSETANLDRDRVVGFVTTMGGSSSHAAILARSIGIPAIAGIEARVLQLAPGTRAVLDGTKGTLRTNISESEVAQIRDRQVRINERRERERAAAHQPAITTDGHKVDVVANIGSLDDAKKALELGAEGVGLLRSEFLFLGRHAAPTEEQQAEIYHSIAELMPGKPLVIRTLDVGGDKPLPYLPIAPEENPFLGRRGIRIGLQRPEIFRTQVRAIMRAVDAGADIHVMMPMISTIENFREAKAMFEEERRNLGVGEIPLGVMVEVPAVAVMAEQFAREVDFFSVGTNDLTQYTLAMDRGHPQLASQVDGANPAVLSLIERAAAAAHKYDRWIGVCGGIASDPQAIPLLVGMGIDELSCSIPAIPSVKAQIREYSLDQCRDVASQALAETTVDAVRNLVPLEED